MSDEMKKCPYCGEEIKAVAIKCRFCGSMLNNEGTAPQQQTIQPTPPVMSQMPNMQQPSYGNSTPQQQPGYGFSQYPVQRKTRLSYILFGVFFGHLGVHNFYAGYTGRGVAQLLITLLLGWLFGLGIVVSIIWALIEVCSVTQDAKGIPFS